MPFPGEQAIDLTPRLQHQLQQHSGCFVVHATLPFSSVKKYCLIITVVLIPHIRFTLIEDLCLRM